MDNNEVYKRFVEDTKNHVMEVIRDDGHHRHLIFGRPEDSAYRFEIITWPGYLCYCGDMGTYVFSRIPDMFRFFRRGEDCKINPSYWGEKLQSIGTNAGYEQFSLDVFKENVKDYFDICEFENDTEKAEDWMQVRHEILDPACDDGNGWVAVQSVVDFKSDHGLEFTDFWEHSHNEYTWHYIWCLYALVDSIKKYDEHNLKIEHGRNR